MIRKKTGISPEHKLIHTKRPEWVFAGGISNITGGFDLFELGSMRRVRRTIRRENFLEEYIHDVAGLFDLNDGQQKLLKMFLSKMAFAGEFDYNAEVRATWAEALEMSVNTVEMYFRSLCSMKGLVIKVRKERYRLNREMLFMPGEIKNADFLSFHITYEFERDGEKALGQEHPEVTMETINKMIEVFNARTAADKKLNKLEG